MNARKSAAKHACLLKFKLDCRFLSVSTPPYCANFLFHFFFGCCARAEKGASILSKIWALINNEILSKFAMPRRRRRATIKSLQPAHNRIRILIARDRNQAKGKERTKKKVNSYMRWVLVRFFFVNLV